MSETPYDERERQNRGRKLLIQSVVLLISAIAVCFLESDGVWSRVEMLAGQSGKGFFTERALADTALTDEVAEEMGAWKGRAAAPRELEENLADKVVVIDAGHGGLDTGTYTYDQSVIEKDCNLEIVRYLKTLLDETDIQVYYTRLEDEDISKKRRVKLAHEKDADLFISVHVNAGDWGDQTSSGVEALYSERDYKKSNISGKRLAKKLSASVSEAVGGRDRGAKCREELYLMKHSRVPVSIIEVGYISSPSDIKYINSKKGQYKMAEAIFQTILDVLQE